VIGKAKFEAITKVSAPPKGEVDGGTEILVMPWIVGLT